MRRTVIGLLASLALLGTTAYYASGWQTPPPAAILLDHWPVFGALLSIAAVCLLERS